MAYQNVGTPRFYVDYLQWYKALGLVGIPSLHNTAGHSYFWNLTGANAASQENSNIINNLLSLNPSFDWRHSGGLVVDDAGDVLYPDAWNYNISIDTSFPVHDLNMLGILGHNFKTTGGQFAFSYRAEDVYDENLEGDFIYPAILPTDDIKINCITGDYGEYGAFLVPEHDGFSFSSCSGTTSDLGATGGMFPFVMRDLPDSDATFRMPTLFAGRTYDMPHSPDLKVKLSYDYDGIKNITSKGGATLSNAMYTKPADWGDRGAWQLGNDSSGNPLSNLRSGRRVWDLSFSYLSSTDVFPVNANTSYTATLQDQDAAGYASGDFNANEDEFTSNVLDGTDFFSEVWNKTMGGHLPFIFQPDGGGGVAGAGNFNPDQFCIARFDMKSLQYDQVANNVYNVKLKIRESW